MPVLAIKKSLEAYTTIAVENQLLEKDGMVLDDYHTGYDVGIRPGVTLHMKVKNSRLGNQPTTVPSSQRTFILTESSMQQTPQSAHLSYDRQPHAVSVSPVPYSLHSRGVSPPRR
eukprot:TRINITY_DN23246_c0_g1_i1.p1 TRINITY_DN23246_c0_g1~~TRINITY_DN23246_c0_g1_i1.p1  ORF type:complete len:115 (+),score=41.46 TRINITY_DN23246_c0_g1_i1:224-568(+)